MAIVWRVPHEIIKHLKYNNMKLMIQKVRAAFAIQNVSGLLKADKYLRGMTVGMLFEYVYRVDSDVWYLPLGIGVLMCV